MRHSAGLLLNRVVGGAIEVLLVHPGGPFWAGRDEHAWSVPKGEYDPASEDSLAAARREFEEEMGKQAPPGAPTDLGEFRQNSGKTVRVWSVQADLDVAEISSNTFQLEWPPRSGSMQEFPEVDRAEWFDIETARTRIHKGQLPILDELVASLPSS